jgi:3-hydroxybutyryl-CoA dehydrogenase
VSIVRIAVVGAGTMGHGIAQVAAEQGLQVVMTDVSADAVARGRDNIAKRLARGVDKGQMSAPDRDAIMARIAAETELGAVADADLIVEAATENPDLKLALFRDLDACCREEAILASNTSSISLTRVAGATRNPARVIGLHFFNPVPVMKLVEIIRALQTGEETYAKARAFVEKLGKTPVTVKDSPGFVVNRMLVPMINEAVHALAEGLATAEEIDAAMKLGANHPIGPLALADLIGLDVCLYVMDVLAREFGDSKYRACPLLRQMVDAGYMGRKSGRGFFSYGS